LGLVFDNLTAVLYKWAVKICAVHSFENPVTQHITLILMILVLHFLSFPSPL
jgi:hypothetical protein